MPSPAFLFGIGQRKVSWAKAKLLARSNKTKYSFLFMVICFGMVGEKLPLSIRRMRVAFCDMAQKRWKSVAYRQQFFAKSVAYNQQLRQGQRLQPNSGFA